MAKRITLPDVKFSGAEIGEDGKQRIFSLTAIEMLRLIAYNPGPQGLTIPEQRKRTPLWETLEAAKDGSLLLEDAEWAILTPLVDAFPFGQTGKNIVEFGDAIANPETVSIEELGLNREARRRVAKKEDA